MKKLFILSLGVLALVPFVSGTAVQADNTTAVEQVSDMTPELARALQAQAAGGSLSRPL
jgi:Ser/Thr protein kinase RdoA (MazF antagonist)